MCNELGLFEMLADHSNVFRFSKKNGVIGTNLPYQKRLCLPYPSPLWPTPPDLLLPLDDFEFSHLGLLPSHPDLSIIHQNKSVWIEESRQVQQDGEREGDVPSDFDIVWWMIQLIGEIHERKAQGMG
jgi:hypothetical protein